MKDKGSRKNQDQKKEKRKKKHLRFSAEEFSSVFVFEIRTVICNLADESLDVSSARLQLIIRSHTSDNISA